MSTTTSSSSPTDMDVEEVFPVKKKGRPPGTATHPVHALFVYSPVDKISRCTVKTCTRPEVLNYHAGNLMKHLKAHHRKLHATTLAEANKFNSAPKKRKLYPSTLNGVKMSKPALQVHCVRLVTESGLSFKVLDYPAFQDIVKPLIDSMPAADRFAISSKTIPEHIPEFTELVRDRIRSELEGKMVSLKVDGCTKRHRYFVGINVQFTLNGVSVVRTLAVEEMLQAATANNLRVLIGIALKKFRIDARLQLVAFTVDSGANYVLAGKLLAELQVGDEEATVENAVESAKETTAETTEETATPTAQTVEEVEVQQQAEDDLAGDWLHSSIELNQDDFSMQGVRCACHTVQLSVGDALKMEKDLNKTIDAVRKLAKYLLRETHARELRIAKMPLPQLDVVTRWGSTYDMLKSVANLRNFLDYTFQWSNSARMEYDLSDEEWERVDGILEDLKPVRLATTQLQREDITLGEFFAVWSGVVLALEKRKHASSLARGLLKAMEQRAKAVPYKDRSKGNKQEPLFHYPSFCAAVFLDPRFMALLTPEQVQEAKSYLLDLSDRMKNLEDPTSPQSESESDSGAESDEDMLLEDEDEGTALFRGLLENKNKERLAVTGAAQSSTGASNNKASRRATLRALLDEHDRTTPPLSAKENVFTYWEKQKMLCPELYALAMVVLSIPASQVSVERLFSALRFILRPQRFGLSSRHVDDVMFLHANKDVVRSVVEELLQKKPPPRRPSATED
ncbi:uncharacterized protein LOC117652049 [Thrips palmi]|uniref:Uncharacterized protein LOC117652049 n=1 Tax=Thrips palmi TaxID=161013 RepID=A0A6P9A5R0_THRPL|nr:uncharacterized protein LOC117652049 [Thrips palmi]